MKFLLNVMTFFVLQTFITCGLSVASINLDSLKLSKNGFVGVWSIKNDMWSFWSKDKRFSDKVSYLDSLQTIKAGFGYHVVGQYQKEIRQIISDNQKEVSVLIEKSGWAYVNLSNKSTFTFKENRLNGIKEISYFDKKLKAWVSWKLTSLEGTFEIPKKQSFWVYTNKDSVSIGSDNKELINIKGNVKLKTTNVRPELSFNLGSEHIEKRTKNLFVLHKESNKEGFYLDVNSFHSKGVHLDYLKIEQIEAKNKNLIFSKRNYSKSFTNERVFVNPKFGDRLEFIITTKVLHSDVKQSRFFVEVKDQRLTSLKRLFNNLKRTTRLRSTNLLSANEIDMIELSVSGEGIEPTRVETYPANTTDANITIIAGPQRTFLVRFIDILGDVIKEASTTVDVSNTINSPLSLQVKDLGFTALNLSHQAGQYGDAFDLQMSISSGKLFYTLDGSNPKLNTSIVFEASTTSIHIDASIVLKVFIKEDGGRRSGVFTHNYELGGTPTVDLEVLSKSYQNQFLAPAVLKFTSNFANTKVFYSLDGSTVSTVSDFGTVPFSVVVTNSNLISYFGLSSLGEQSQQKTTEVFLLNSSFSLAPNVESLISGDLFNNKYFFPVDILFESNLPETKVFYSTDSSAVTTLSSFEIAPFHLTINENTNIKYFAKSVVDIQSDLSQLEILGHEANAISADIAIAFSSPEISGHYTFPMTATFTGFLNVKVFYTIDGSTPTTSSSSAIVPFDLMLTQASNIKWFGSVSESIISTTQSIDLLELSDGFYETRDTYISANGVRVFSGNLLGGETLNLLIDGVDSSSLVQLSADGLSYHYEITPDSNSNEIVFKILNQNNDELALFNNVINNPILNHVFGGPSYGLPSQYFSMNLVGGYGSAAYNYETEEKVFYNSMSGSLIKVNKSSTVSLVRNFGDLAIFNELGDIGPSIDYTNNDQLESFEKFSKRSGVVSARGLEYVFTTLNWLNDPVSLVHEGQNYQSYLATKIYKYNGQNLSSIAGLEPQSSVSFLNIVDLIGTSQSFVATHTYLGDEVAKVVQLQDRVLFVAGTSIFEISINGQLSWLMGASFESFLSGSLIAMQSINWQLRAFEKTGVNSIMISALVSDVSIPLTSGLAQYIPMKIYQLTQSLDSSFITSEKYTIGDNLISLDYLKDNIPAAQMPASILVNGEYHDVIESFSFSQNKVYFIVRDSRSIDASLLDFPNHLYSMDVETGLLKQELNPTFGFVQELSSPLNELKKAPNEMLTMGDEILFVYLNELDRNASSNNSSPSTGGTTGIINSIGSASSNNNVGLELGLLNPSTNNVSLLMDDESELVLNFKTEILLTNGSLYTLREEFDHSVATFSTQIIKKDYFKSIDENEENSIFEIPFGITINKLIYHSFAKKLLGLTSSLEGSMLTSFTFDSKKSNSLSTSASVFIQNFPNALSTMTPLISGASEISDMNTLAFASGNNLTLNQISLPRAEYLEIIADDTSSNILIKIKVLNDLQLYRVDINTLEVQSIVDFSIGLPSNDGQVVLDFDAIELAQFVGDVVFLIHKGSVYKLNISSQNLDVLHISESTDIVNAQSIPDKSSPLFVQDLTFSKDVSHDLYTIFNYPENGQINISGISKGIPRLNNVIFSFVRSEFQNVAVEAEFDFDQKTIQQLVQESWSTLDEQKKILIKDIPNFIAMSLSDVKFKSSFQGIYLQSSGFFNTQLLALDPRPIISSDLLISNVHSLSGSTNLVAHDVIEFNYQTNNNENIDFHATIGSEVVEFNNGIASLELGSFVGNFNTNILAGAVGIDLLGRKTKVFQGLNIALSYEQSILDFVPQTSTITIESSLVEPLVFQSSYDFSLKSTPFSTLAIVILRANGAIVEVKQFPLHSRDDFTETFIHLDVPDGVDQIVIEIANPNGNSGSPLVYDLKVMRLTTISGAFGTGYGADHSNIEPIRLLKRNSAGGVPFLLSEKSNSDFDLKSHDLFKITENNTIEGSSYFAAFVDEFGDDAFEKILGYSDVTDSIFGQVAIESIFNSETSSFETLIEEETSNFGTFEETTLMSGVIRYDGQYELITFVNDSFYLLGKTLDSDHVLLKTTDFINVDSYFLLDEVSDFVKENESSFLTYDEETNSLLMGIRSFQKAYLYQFDINSPAEPTILFTQDVTLNSELITFDDDRPEYLNSSGLYGFFAAYYFGGKLYVGLNTSDTQSGGVVVEMQSTPFANQDEDSSSIIHKAYFKPHIGRPSHQFFEKYSLKLKADINTNATKSILNQNGRLFKLDFANNLVEIIDNIQSPILVKQEQTSDVAQGLVKAYDPFDFHQEIRQMVANYSKLDQGLILGLEDGSVAYYNLNQMKIYPCKVIEKYREIKQSTDGLSTLVSNDLGQIYKLNMQLGTDYCGASLKVTLPKTSFNSGHFSFAEIDFQNIYLSYDNQITLYDRASKQSTEIVSFTDSLTRFNLSLQDGLLYYLKSIGVEFETKQFFSLDPTSGQETFIQGDVKQVYRKDGLFFLLTSNALFSYDPNTTNKKQELSLSFDGKGAYAKDSPLSDIKAYELVGFASGLNNNIGYLIQNFRGNSQIKRVELSSFPKPSIVGSSENHGGLSILTNGDKITFQVQMDGSDPVVLNARYNGQKLDFLQKTSGFYEADYYVSSRSIPQTLATSLVGLRAINQYGEISDITNIFINGNLEISPISETIRDLKLLSVKFSRIDTGVFNIIMSVENTSSSTIDNVEYEFLSKQISFKTSAAIALQPKELKTVEYVLDRAIVFPTLGGFFPIRSHLRVGVLPQVGRTNSFYDERGADNYAYVSENQAPKLIPRFFSFDFNNETDLTLSQTNGVQTLFLFKEDDSNTSDLIINQINSNTELIVTITVTNVLHEGRDTIRIDFFPVGLANDLVFEIEVEDLEGLSNTYKFNINIEQ
ncbi:MAG: hypothetical protein COB02_02895 [Candidatus Cloacimonadota bacterium]|nr:MAG: hypothetical protein COB02_02895 [Candidatus Cloacimonadota bacterium]